MAGDVVDYTVSLHGEDVHVVRAGAGPAVVLLHGVLGSRHDWRRLVKLLARDFMVIAPDLLGHGDSAHKLRRLLPRRARRAAPRPARPTRGERRDPRGALSRRRRRDAVRVAVPGKMSAARASQQRRAGSRPEPAAARTDLARRRLAAAAGELEAAAQDRRDGEPGRCAGSGSCPRRTSRRCGAAT